MLKRLPGHPFFFWMILALPSIPMVIGLSTGRMAAGDLLHSSGEVSARLMIIAMLASPLRLLFPRARWLAWWAQRRRALGVAAFCYALGHLLFYVVDMGSAKTMLAEFWALGIWTGWAGFAIFVPLAITSNEFSVRRLGTRWKLVHRGVYAAAILTLVHWIFVHNNLGPALVHFVPLAVLETIRIAKLQSRRMAAASQ